MNKAPRTNQYKYLIFLATLYITLGICCPTLLVKKLILSPYGVISASSFVSPLWFILGDIIAEIYGFQIVMRLFWADAACEFIFALFCEFMISLPSPSYYSIESYKFIFSYAFFQEIASTVAIIIAWRTNAYLLTKWKILTKGKYFWLRSIGASAIGETLFSVIMFPTYVFLNVRLAQKDVIDIVVWACLLRIFFTGIFAAPCLFIVRFLKVIEESETRLRKFHPFNKFSAKKII